MFEPLAYECCQGTRFGILPFVGSFEIVFLGAALAGVAVFLALLLLIKKLIGTTASVALFAALLALPRLAWPWLVKSGSTNPQKVRTNKRSFNPNL